MEGDPSNKRAAAPRHRALGGHRVTVMRIASRALPSQTQSLTPSN
jgi:hypothetical protein